MKPQIILCVLALSGSPLLADEAALVSPVPAEAYSPANAYSVVQTVDSSGFPTPAIALAGAPGGQPVAPESMTAPPVVVSPDGTPVTSQYQPGAAIPPAMPVQPGYGAPTMDPYGNPMVTPFGAPGCPPAGNCCPPGGMMDPGCCNSIFPYKAMTPDVTMAPTTPNGPMPDRTGWIQRYEIGYLPFADARDNWGHFSEFAFDLDWKYITPLFPVPAVFSFTQQYDLRLWSGPQSPSYLPPPPANLPGAVDRIGWDFELKSALPQPWNAVVAFNPSIDSDFQSALTRNAWNWDARAAFLYTPTRELTAVLGVVMWDRIHERVLPWAGVIYRPDQYWQFDLTFPQARVSAYLWDEFGFKTSLYGRIEYHTEAYQILNPVINQTDRVELNDWRALMGVDKDRGNFAYFLEGGWVFGRTIHYKYNPNGDVDINSGGIVRGGIRY